MRKREKGIQISITVKESVLRRLEADAEEGFRTLSGEVYRRILDSIQREDREKNKAE